VLLWILAALVVVGALGWLVMALIRTWKLVMATGRSVAESGEKLANASAGLEAASAQRDRPFA
jgi:hypothetical protein